MSDISVMAYYTIPFKNTVTDPVLYIERLLEGANQVFQNSELPIKLTQLCIEELDVQESSNSNERLKGFLYAKSNLTWSKENDMMAAELILNTADMAILMTSTAIDRIFIKQGAMALRQNGGRAFGGPSPIEKKPPLAWVSAGYDVTVGDPVQSFTHEIGHIFGCYHNREELFGGQENRTNYGYLINGTNYFTTMAYQTENHNVWIPVFSSSNITYNGSQIGDTQNDNSKTLLETRFLISQIGDESGKCSSAFTSCAGKCLRGSLGPANLTTNDREIWCRSHCNMSLTGYYNLLGKPVGLHNITLARLHIYETLRPVIQSVMILLSIVYFALLWMGNFCLPERNQYRKLKITVTASTNIIAVLEALLNIGCLGLFVIYNDGVQEVLNGVLAFLMGSFVDIGFLGAVRDI